MADISEEVRRFIDRYIPSIERLEVFLLVQANPDRQWTAGSVASALRIGGAAADEHLAELCSHNFLEVRVGTDLYYRYNPRPPHIELGARALAAAYADERLGVIRRILDRPPAALRDFAEAFRLTKKGDSNG